MTTKSKKNYQYFSDTCDLIVYDSVTRISTPVTRGKNKVESMNNCQQEKMSDTPRLKKKKRKDTNETTTEVTNFTGGKYHGFTTHHKDSRLSNTTLNLSFTYVIYSKGVRTQCYSCTVIYLTLFL